jgi:hypothetical protein
MVSAQFSFVYTRKRLTFPMICNTRRAGRHVSCIDLVWIVETRIPARLEKYLY